MFLGISWFFSGSFVANWTSEIQERADLLDEQLKAGLDRLDEQCGHCPACLSRNSFYVSLLEH